MKATQTILLSPDLGLRTRVLGALRELEGSVELVAFEDEARALGHAREQRVGVFVIDARERETLAEGYARRLLNVDQPPELLIVTNGPTRILEELRRENYFSGRPDDDAFAEQLRRLVSMHEVRKISGIVGRTPAIQDLLGTVVQVAPLDLPVLVHGESGTGKEMVARSLHAMSGRSQGPFVSINVGSLAESLLESELFGHEKGSFTGAVQQHAGVFERARGGTILLDELGEISPAMQVKLLRVLEASEFQRVGGSQTLHTDVRMIGATHRDLEHEMRQGRFRSDLYYRLKVIKIDIPPLRERRDDILVLAQHFLEEVNLQHGLGHRGFTPEAMKRLRAYKWPGNVRELRNVIASMAVLSRQEYLDEGDLPRELREGEGEHGYYPVPTAAGQRSDGAAADPLLASTLFQLLTELKDVRERLERIEAQLSRPTPGGAAGLHLDAGMRVPNSDLEADEAEYTPLSGEIPADLPGAERALIDATLRQFSGNRRKAAEQLGISERTLYRKIHRYGLG